MISQHDALYQAVCAHPNEDTPRLVFADLIEEEGDRSTNLGPAAAELRATFIRTQVALARVPEYDPLHISARQMPLDACYGSCMTHVLPKKIPAGYCWRKFEFRRGFPWKVGVESLKAFDKDGDAIFNTAPIQALEILTRVNGPELADWPGLSRIECLGFSLERIAADSLSRLGNSPFAGNLREISFEYDSIAAEGLEAFCRSSLFPRLTTLSLDSNIIPPALLVDALAVVREPGALSRLSLISSSLSPVDAAHLFALPLVQRLAYLDLSHNPQLGVAGARALAESGSTRGLRLLNLSNTFPGVPGIRELVEKNRLTGVRSLDLSANRLGPVAIKMIADSEVARGLRVLDLASNPIQDSGAKAVASSSSLSGLLELNLRGAELTDAGALALAESSHLNGLIRLDLTGQAKSRQFSGKCRRILVERFGRAVVC